MTNSECKVYTITRNGEICGYQGEPMTLKEAKMELAMRLKNFRVNNPYGKFELMITKIEPISVTTAVTTE